jgi:hypothetical protein
MTHTMKNSAFDALLHEKEYSINASKVRSTFAKNGFGKYVLYWKTPLKVGDGSALAQL